MHTEDWGAHLVNFRRQLSQTPKKRGKGTLSDNVTKLMANAVRSYLVYVGASLTLTRAQKFALTKIESMPEKDYPLNIKVKELLMRVANEEEDYVLCAGISFGLRVSDFIGIRRGQVAPLIDMEPPIPLGDFMTKKEGITANPFIDRDAKEAIQKLLKKLDSEGRTDASEPMLKLKPKYPEEQVNSILKGLFKKAEIPLGEFRVRFHILRKFLTDRLASVCSEDKWKHFVGKKTRSPYVSMEGWEAYKKVMEFTCVNHKNIARPEEIEGLRRELVEVKQENRALRKILREHSNTIRDIVGSVERLETKVEAEANKEQR